MIDRILALGAVLLFASPSFGVDCILSFDNSCIRDVPSASESEVEAAYQHRMETLEQLRQDRLARERAELLADLWLADRQQAELAEDLHQRLLSDLVENEAAQPGNNGPIDPLTSESASLLP